MVETQTLVPAALLWGQSCPEPLYITRVHGGGAGSFKKALVICLLLASLPWVLTGQEKEEEMS